MTDVGGTKHDRGKVRYDLLPPELLDGVAQVLTFGAQKYGDNNWRRGITYSRIFGAVMRHLWAYWRGEDTDPESGLPHLWHAATNIGFLIAMPPRFDDRWTTRPEKLP